MFKNHHLEKTKIKDLPRHCVFFIRNYKDIEGNIKNSWWSHKNWPQPLPDGNYLFHKYNSCQQLVKTGEEEVYQIVENE